MRSRREQYRSNHSENQPCDVRGRVARIRRPACSLRRFVTEASLFSVKAAMVIHARLLVAFLPLAVSSHARRGTMIRSLKNGAARYVSHFQATV